jgi:hypothetical protein
VLHSSRRRGAAGSPRPARAPHAPPAIRLRRLRATLAEIQHRLGSPDLGPGEREALDNRARQTASRLERLVTLRSKMLAVLLG